MLYGDKPGFDEAYEALDTLLAFIETHNPGGRITEDLRWLSGRFAADLAKKYEDQKGSD